MTNQSKVLILGYGEMGHAMEHLLIERCSLDIWTKRPHDNFNPVVLDDAVTMADIILFCLPVNPHREIAEHIAPLLKPECLCLSIAKGLDEAGNTAAQIFSDVFSEHQAYGFLYGPMISEEIQANRYAFAQVACSNTILTNKVKSLFYGTNLYLETSTDVLGISWSVILKNVYALAFGMADELRLGDNMRGFLTVAALQELDKIAYNMGGQTGSPYHLAGLGDLITTATSEDSHHHELGRILAREINQQDSFELKGEGIHTLKMVDKFNLLNKEDYPLFKLIHSIVLEPKNIRSKLASYLQHQYD